MYDAAVTAFVVARDRDAYATIRGFVYQIELTLSRWMELAETEALELECGEDIDVVGRVLGAEDGDPSVHRILEQVKYRAKAITLRSPESLGAIANFVEHREANPGLRLRFRFVTHAEAGRERPTTLPDNYSGIGAWEAIRRQEVQGEVLRDLLRGLGTLLQTAEVPGGAAPLAWARLQEIARSEAELRSLVGDFEWSLRAGMPAEVAEGLRETLLRQFGASDAETAQIQYLRLFDRAVRTLCRPGLKRLTAKDRDEILVQPSPTPEEQRRHALLREVLGELREIVDGHGRHIQRLEDQMGDVQVQLQKMVGTEFGPLLPEGAPDLSLPIGLVHAASRREAIDLLGKASASATWTVVQGGLGSGKSELVRTFVARRSTRHPWVRLRDLGPAAASARLRQAARHVSCGRTFDDPKSLGRALAEYVGREGLLVLDDMPRVDGGGELFDDVVRIVNALDAVGGRLLSTSSYDIDPAVRERFDGSRLAVLSAPTFTDDDIREWLRSVDAPERWSTREACGYLAMRSSRHPVLLADAIRGLKSMGWPLVDDFERAAGERPTPERATMRRLVRSVPVEDRRNLLYRLTLVRGPISTAEVRAVAEAPPPIGESQAHVSELAGLWLQTDSGDRYVVSPLVARLGDTELTEVVRRTVNRQLGMLVLSRGSLGVSDVVRAWYYLTDAGMRSKAVALLTWALGAARAAGDRRTQLLLLRLGRNASLTEVSAGMQINLRATQISVAARLGKSAADIETELAVLLDQPLPDGERWSLVVAATALTIARGPKNDGLVSRVFSLALQHYSTARLPNGVEIADVMPETFEQLIWLQAGNVQSSEGVAAWLQTLESMSPEQRQTALAGDSYLDGCSAISSRVWLRENAKPRDEQNWSSAESLLGEIETAGRRLGLEPLWAWALRIRIIALAEHLGRPEDAIAFGREGLIVAVTPLGQFALRDVIGHQLVGIGRSGEARPYLEEAQLPVFEGFELFRIRSRLELASILGREERAKAVSLTGEALDLANETAALPASEVVMCLAEAAIARFDAGGVSAAFDAWDDALGRVVDGVSAEPTDKWKGLLVRCGHVSGYFVSMARTGAPPERKAGTPYAQPKLGMFLGESASLAGFFAETSVGLLMTHGALYAEAVGRDDRAAAWALRGIDEATRTGDKPTLAILATTAVNPLIVAGDYGAALDAAFRGASIASEALATISPDAGQRPPEKVVDEAEERALALAVVPVALQLAVAVQSKGEDVAARINRIGIACEILAGRSARPDMWKSAAGVLEESFVRGATVRRLYEESQRLGAKYGRVFQAVAYIGAAISPNASLEDTLAFQWEVRRYVLNAFGSKSSTLRLFLDPFVETFWGEATREQRYRFRNPQILAVDFEAARAVGEGTRAGAILRVVGSALGVILKGE